MQRMPESRKWGRPRTAWMDNIKTWTGLTMEESIRMAEDRDKWRKYVHGLTNPWIEDGWSTEQNIHEYFVASFPHFSGIQFDLRIQPYMELPNTLHCLHTYLRNHYGRALWNVVYVSRLSSYNSATRYVFPVLWMASCFHIIYGWRLMWIPNRGEDDVTAETTSSITTEFFSTITTGKRSSRGRGLLCMIVVCGWYRRACSRRRRTCRRREVCTRWKFSDIENSWLRWTPTSTTGRLSESDTHVCSVV